jgi:hypothetical protein
MRRFNSDAVFGSSTLSRPGLESGEGNGRDRPGICMSAGDAPDARAAVVADIERPRVAGVDDAASTAATVGAKVFEIYGVSAESPEGGIGSEEGAGRGGWVDRRRPRQAREAYCPDAREGHAAAGNLRPPER